MSNLPQNLGGQFRLELGGQFAPKLMVNLDWKVVVNLTVFSSNDQNGVITSTTSETISENPYPRIFTSNKAFDKFKKLLDEFGNTKENLVNYSFVFHRMKRDGLIYDDFQKLQFTYFLLKFEINIDRIKPMKEIGKLEYRESIYMKTK